MGRSRTRSLSRKKPRRRSSSRSKHSKGSRHRSPDRKSKYRRRSSDSSDSSNRYKSSSKYKSKRSKKRDSPPPHRSRRSRRSTSSSDSSSRSSSSSSSSNESKNTHRSSSSDKLHRNKPSSSYIEKIRAMRTPTPPPQPNMNFEAGMEFLDKRHVSDALEEINANEFKPKAFSSSVGKSDADIIKVKGEVRATKYDPDDDPLFHQKVFGDDDVRMEQWVHRLYSYRQKMFGQTN